MFVNAGDRAGRKRISGTGTILEASVVQSPVLSSSQAFRFNTKNNLGIQTARLQIMSGQTVANTQINFFNIGTANFNQSKCQNLAEISTYSPGIGSIGRLDMAWGDAYITNIVGGDDQNGTDFTIKTTDGGGTQITLLTVPLGGSPQTATWGCHHTMGDARNIAVGTTTGTKIGTAITQKIGFYNVTPIAQRAGVAQTAVATTGSAVAGFGYTTAAQADAIVTLVNELRAWAVAQGFIKGAA